MANFICEFEGVRGRNLKLYDTKIIITTKKTAGSLLTGNFTDGEKTIFLCDIIGVQFKKSGLAIGYIQFETSSPQMNNKNSNFFSENTFTFEKGRNGITNELMIVLYNYITDRIEEIKYGSVIINKTPDFESMKVYQEYVDNTEGSQNCDDFVNEFVEEEPNGLKCEMCEQYVEYLTYCKIKDEFGTRYRNICDDCVRKYNATKQ